MFRNLDKIKNNLGADLYNHIGSLNETQLQKQLKELRSELSRISNNKDDRYYKLKDEEFFILYRLERANEFQYAKGGKTASKFKKGDKISARFKGSELMSEMESGYGESVDGTIVKVTKQGTTTRYHLEFENGKTMLVPDFVANQYLHKKEYAKGGKTEENMGVQFSEYKGKQIMFEPYFEKYYTNDIEFDTMEEAKKYIDGGSKLQSWQVSAYRSGIMAKGGEVGDYSNQTGLKKMLLDDNDFDKLLLSNERMFIRKPDVKIFKKTTGLYFTDGKREIVFNATKPISKIKKLGNASSIIKEVYSSDKYAKGGNLNYKGHPISKEHPSGFYSFYSDKQKRFIKADSIQGLKSIIDKESKMAKGGGVGRGKNKNIKEWYLKNYPDDEMGEELNDFPTFDALWRYMNQGYNVYEVLGVGDSMIRERVFEHLAKVHNLSYDEVYKKWLSSNKYANGGLLTGFNYSIGGL